MGFDIYMIAGSRACSTFSPATQPNITNQTSPHYAEALGVVVAGHALLRPSIPG
jgi:hypothetical protein